MTGSPHDPHRLVGYVASMSTFTAALTGTALLVGRRGGAWPTHYAASDLVLGAVATHKVARIVTKEGVTAPLRAPFTVYEGEEGAGELAERPRHGVRHAPGELLTCPFCMAPWVAAAYVAGLALAPGPTRALGALFTTVAGSDALQHVYSRLRAD